MKHKRMSDKQVAQAIELLEKKVYPTPTNLASCAMLIGVRTVFLVIHMMQQERNPKPMWVVRYAILISRIVIEILQFCVFLFIMFPDRTRYAKHDAHGHWINRFVFANAVMGAALASTELVEEIIKRRGVPSKVTDEYVEALSLASSFATLGISFYNLWSPPTKTYQSILDTLRAP